MKKINIFILVMIAIFSISCSNGGVKKSNVEVTLGSSKNFSDQEIKEGADFIFKDFGFPACELEIIEFDEEYSDTEIERYKKSNVTVENSLIYKVQFKVDNTGDNPVLNSGMTYNYMWILTKDKDGFKTVDFGI